MVTFKKEKFDNNCRIERSFNKTKLPKTSFQTTDPKI